MTTRQELLTQWQQRLTDAEQASAAAPSWAERMRVKLYRFLLAMYLRTTWPGSKDDVDNSQLRAANSQLIVAEAQQALAGKVPRTRAEILNSLRNLKGLGEELAPAGPLAGGVSRKAPVFFVAAERIQDCNVASRSPRESRQRTAKPDVGLSTFLICVCTLMAIFFSAKFFDGLLLENELPADLAWRPDLLWYCGFGAMASYLAAGVAIVWRVRQHRSLRPAKNS